MSLVASALLAFLPQAQGAAPPASWDSLATEYDLAFERRIQERSKDPSEGDDGDHLAATYWARFEALADQGEGRANLWLLVNLESLPKKDPALAASVLARVRRAGDADWLGSALFYLGANRALFDESELAGYLEQCMVTSALDPLRAYAALALSEVVAQSDASQASYLRVWAARLVHQGVDLAPDAVLARADVETLGEKVLDAVEKESQGHFALAYRKGSDDVYYPVSGAPPDPEERWRPVIEELATRGSKRAQLWALSNAPWQLDEGGKQRLRGFLEVAVKSELSEEELRSFGWSIGGLVYRLGLPAVEPSLRGLIDRSPETARPGLLFGLGDAVCEAAGEDAAQRERGLAVLREVRERWPNSDEAGRAEGRIFRYTNLVIGKVCPDFETVDADGSAFKLSDYEGKVTVVDFWGFW